MPHVIFLGVIAVAAYLGYKAFLKEAERVTKATRKAQAKRSGRPTESLVFDKKTGKYKLKDND